MTYIQHSGSPPVGDGGDQYTGWDRFSRVIDVRWLNGSGADIERVKYGFDRASNRTYRQNTVAAGGQDELYTYDELSQLLTLRRGTLNGAKTNLVGTPTWVEKFAFDPTGNWSKYVTKVNGTRTLNQPRTHNVANEIQTISGSATNIEQNDAGNIVKAPRPSNWNKGYNLVYDAWNRLVKVTGGGTTKYAYDGQNRRIAKTGGNIVRHYYYTQSWQIIEERIGSSTSADRQFVWGLRYLDDLIERDNYVLGSVRHYALQDYYSCTAVTDSTGVVLERYGYDAFGKPRYMDASFGSKTATSYDWETLYADYRYDQETGFYQVRNRYLHPTLGRWVS
jgi:YD repeat-containing protein